MFAFEGAIGGRVGYKNAKIEVTGPRSVKDVSGTMRIDASSLVTRCAKLGKLKVPLEISSDPGAAIKG